MPLRRPTALAALLLPALLAACDGDPARPDIVVERAVIAPGGMEPEVVVAQDGDAFVIEITTWGTPCTSAHHDDVTIESGSRTIVVTPYDQTELVDCFASLEPISHVVSVAPDVTGDWLIRVIGSHITDEEDVIVEREASFVPIVIDNPNAG